MASPRQIARFAPEGVAPDQGPEVLPDEYYSRARDVYFRDGAERVAGLVSVYGTPLFPPRWLLFTPDQNGVPGWIYATNAGIAWTEGANHIDITPTSFLGPTKANPYTGGLLNGVPVVSSRRPWYWTGDQIANMDILPDWPLTLFAESVRPYKFHLIAMGITSAGTEFDDEVRWSAAANPGQIPGSWTPAADNEAGSAQLGQTGGKCVDGAQLRSSFVIYKETSTYLMDYVGGSQVMTVRPLFSESGILASNCVAAVASEHVVLTDGDVIRHDGQRVERIADAQVRRAIFRGIDGTNARESFVVSNYADSEVWVCVPEQGSKEPNIAFVVDIKTGRWGVRDLPELASHMAPGQVRLVPNEQSWDSDAQAWDDDTTIWDQSSGRVDFYELLEASQDSNALNAIDLSNDRNGAPVTASLEKNGISLGDLERIKTVKAVWLNVVGTRGSEITVELAATNDADESPNYSGQSKTFVVGEARKVDLFATGRFFHVRFSSAEVAAPWRITSWSLEYRERGKF